MHKMNLWQGAVRCLMMIALLVGSWLNMSAFEGSDLANGQKYYLYNIYQAKFLGENNKLQSPNIGTPITFTASSTGFTIGGTAYTATKNDAGYYQLKNGSNFYAFEDKVADPNSPDDENRAMYLGGGITCQNTTNDTDRSYWMLISESEYAEWTSKKKFTVASLNVDGMPKSVKVYGVVEINLNPDAKEGPGATAIGNRMRGSGFDVIGTSEDFNFHSELWGAAWNNEQGIHYNATTHRNKINASDPGIITKFTQQKPIADTDGLCTFFRIGAVDQNTIMDSETWTQWNDHYGYTGNGADGLIKKGYRFTVVKLADGTEVDLYTMHMDAESDPEDNAARESQMKQLVTAIKATNNGRPIVIIGDSNCRYTRDKIKVLLIENLNADPRFTCNDPWIQFGRNGVYPVYGTNSIMARDEGYLSGEVVDKIWYVNNTESNIRLVAETYCQDLSFVDDEGSPLCDHKPAVVTFSYHDYDPEIDDVADGISGDVYLRNRATGRYLMNGGWWSSHAVVGNYAKEYSITKLPSGKYDIQSTYGHITDAAFVDNNKEGEYIAEWTILEQDGFYVLAYNQDGTMKALTAEDPTYFNDNPLYRYATTAKLNVQDKHQQWEIVTKEQLKEEIAKATPDNPINVTHYIIDANFDRINNHSSWSFDKKNNGTRVTDEGYNGLGDNTTNDAFCNWNRSIRTSATRTNSNNQWDCWQYMENIPPGYYVVTNQGFEKTTQNTYLYAWTRPEGDDSYVKKTVRLSTYSNDLSSENQVGASQAFNQNKYNNVLPVVKVGSNGILCIGVEKTEKNSSSGWMVFDNFQLYYLGTKNPGREYEYDVIGSTRKATSGNGKLTLTGTWREVDMKDVNDESKSSNLDYVINTNKPLLIDASSNNYLICRPEIQTANAPKNMMIQVAKANDIANAQNVIAEGKCANFVVTDKENFAPLQEFTAQTVRYERGNTSGLNTVCMPFDMNVKDFPESCTVYEYSRQTDDTAYFEEVTDDVIEAGTPVLVKHTLAEGETATWTMNISTDRNVVDYVSGNSTSDEVEGLNGSFLKHELGEGYYKLNSAGTKFVKTTASSTITPFRFYLYEGAATSAKSFDVVLNDEETSLDEIINDPETKIEEIYDISGRRILTISRPGLYIMGGKKVLVK